MEISFHCSADEGNLQNKVYYVRYETALFNNRKMIYITQLVYVKEGQEHVFDQFENIAIPTIANYRGQLLLRIRPTDDTIIESQMDKPYEIHLVAFETDQDFQQFLQDEERKKFLHLKEQSIRSVILIKGTAI